MNPNNSLLSQHKIHAAGTPSLANSWEYLKMLGHVVIAWQWLWQAQVAVKGGDDPYYQGKLKACQFFFRWELPQIRHFAALLSSLDSTLLETSAEQF